MDPNQLSDDQILYLVGKADAELFRAGLDVKKRSWEVPRVLMERFGYTQYVMSGVQRPAILQRVEGAFRSIYRQQDLAMGGHIGVFMYRDIFARIAIPHIFGTPKLNPFEFVDLTPVQLRIIQSEPEEMEVLLDQFSDVADIQYGTEELNAPFAKMDLVVRFLGLARLHLHAAAAIVTGGYDYRGAVQSALLATELSLKSGVAAHGLTEKDIKDKFGHKFTGLADCVGAAMPAFDTNRVRRVIAKQPQYVPNRYASDQPERREVGHIVMGAQYVVAEVVRQMSDRDFRTYLNAPSARRYPV
jgi:hypothetical protein